MSSLAPAVAALALDKNVQKLASMAAKEAAQLALRGAQGGVAALGKAAKQRRRARQQFPKNRGQGREGVQFRYRAPAAESQPLGPRYSRGGGGGRVSSGREFLGNLNGTSSTTVPTVTNYQLNPGLEATFTRLSKEAAVWEEYRFRRLLIKYTPAVATSTAGTIMLAPDYNAAAAPPTTEAGLLNHQGAVSGNPWAPLQIQLNAAAMHGNAARKFIRSQPVAGDLNNYDVGKFIVASLGNGGTGIMGKLWLEYEVEFFIPQVEATAATTNNVLVFNRSSDQTIPKTTVTDIVWNESVQDSFGVTVSDSVVLPKGAWLVTFEGTFQDTAAEAFAATCEILYGGASLPIPRLSSSVGDSAIAGQTTYVSITAYVVTNGSSGIKVICTLTGAAGTLTLVGDYSRLTCLCVSA